MSKTYNDGVQFSLNVLFSRKKIIENNIIVYQKYNSSNEIMIAKEKLNLIDEIIDEIKFEIKNDGEEDEVKMMNDDLECWKKVQKFK